MFQPNMGSCRSSQPPRPSQPPPSSWTPTGFSDPDRESELLLQIQSAINQLNNSRFVHRFLSRLHHPDIQQGFNKLLSFSPHIQIVSYGIGSIESHKGPRLQLALALLLKQELGIKVVEPIQVFDPVLSVVECNVLAALGCRIIVVNECARRETAVPTIFYMPHCELTLYDNLLSANWKPMMLRQMVVLGNSFGDYQQYVMTSLRRAILDSRDVEVNGRHLLRIRGYVREVEMEEREKNRAFKENDDELDFLKAFDAISWHFFELDDDADIGFLANESQSN